MASYWDSRAEYIDRLFSESSGTIIRDQQQLYAELIRSIEREMSHFISSYAGSNGMSVSEAQKILSISELREFRDQVRSYQVIAQKLSEGATAYSKEELDRYISRLRTLESRVRVTRLESLRASLERWAVETGVAQDSLFSSVIPDYTEQVYDYTSYTIDIEEGFSTGLDPIQLDTLFRQRWMDGSFSSRLWQDKETLLKNMRTVILQGIAMGHNPRRIARDLRKKMDSSKSACERIARTEVLHFFNEATYKAYKAHGIEEYMYMASLDEKTCPICGELDGKVFSLSERQEGVNYPVMHPNCRCTTRAYLRLYEESDVENSGTRKAKTAEGEYYEVPGDMTYEEWSRIFL